MFGSLGEILPHAARRFGGRTALVFEGRTVSFAELNDLSDRIAAGLVAQGIQPGDRVSLYAANSWEWIVAYHGVLKMGGVVNPLNMMLTPSEAEYAMNDCGARAVFTTSDKAPGIADIGQRTQVKDIIVFGSNGPPGTTAFDEMLRRFEPGFTVVPVDPDALSTIGYTSGTTGHPKGAMLSHRAIVMNVALTAVMHVRTAADVVVSALPCAHVYGNVVMNGALAYGSTLVLHKAFNEQAVLESIQRHKATMLEGVPTMYMYLLNYPELGRYDLSSLTRCTVGGQTMPVAKMQQVEAAFGCPLVELWGMTELGGLGTTHTAYGPHTLGSIGVPLPHVEARIARVGDAGTTQPTGEVGELMVRGPIVMKGYYGREEATRETIEPDGWLHTGDLAYRDPDGNIFIVDRAKDMIITGGYNIYPAELERVIAQHPSVAMVAVGGLPDEMRGELAVAYIVAAQGRTVDAEEIIAFCRQQLAAYKVPRAVKVVSDLPKTSTGKIMRRELKNMAV